MDKPGFVYDLYEEFFQDVDSGNINDVKYFVDELLKRGISINDPHPDYPSYPLEMVCKVGTVKQLEYMFDIGNVDLNSQFNYGGSCLHCAVETGNTDIVKYLILKKVDLNIQDFNGQTPISIALSHGLYDIFLLLLDSDANINKVDIIGFNLLHDAIYSFAVNDAIDEDTCINIIKILIEKGVDYNIKNNAGNRPIDIAIEYNEEAIVQYLKSVEENDELLEIKIPDE